MVRGRQSSDIRIQPFISDIQIQNVTHCTRRCPATGICIQKESNLYWPGDLHKIKCCPEYKINGEAAVLARTCHRTFDGRVSGKNNSQTLIDKHFIYDSVKQEIIFVTCNI